MDTQLLEGIETPATLDRAAWLRFRKTGIGSSEAAAVCGESEYADSLNVYLTKRGEIGEPTENEAMIAGRIMEPAVIALYSALHAAEGSTVVGPRAFLHHTGNLGTPYGDGYVVWRHKTLPFMLATPDAIEVIMGPGGDEYVPLEIKCPGARQREKWYGGGGPAAYRVQVQHQLHVLRSHYGDRVRRARLIGYFGGSELEIHDIPYDPDFCSEMVRAEADLWKRIASGDAPAPSLSSNTLRALSERWPQHVAGKRIEVPESLVASYVMAMRNEEEAKREVENLRVEFETLLGDAEEAVLADGTVVATWKTQARSGYTVKPGSARVFRITKSGKGLVL